MNITTEAIVSNFKTKPKITRLEYDNILELDKKLKIWIDDRTIHPLQTFDIDKLSKALHKDFHNYVLMLDVIKQVTSWIRHPSGLKHSQHLHCILGELTKVNKGETARVYSAGLSSNGRLCLIKIPKESNPVDIHQEVFISLMVNLLRSYIPNFVMTFDSFESRQPVMLNANKAVFSNVSSKQKIRCLIMEDIYPSAVLTDWINTNVTLKDVLVVLAQITLSLRIAYEMMEFTHYDLHTSNVLIRDGDPSAYIKYVSNLYPTYYVSGKVVATLIDFGFSHIKINEIDVGIRRYENYGIKHDKPFPMHDIYKLYMYIMLYTKNFNHVLYHKLKSIYRFFNSNTELSVALTEQRDTSYSIPYSEEHARITHQNFIEFLIKQFPEEPFITMEPKPTFVPRFKFNDFIIPVPKTLKMVYWGLIKDDGIKVKENQRWLEMFNEVKTTTAYKDLFILFNEMSIIKTMVDLTPPYEYKQWKKSLYKKIKDHIRF